MQRGQEHWQNPFNRNLVEDWRLEEFPERYWDVVFCFFPPYFMDILESVDVRPKIIMGGRGTGKTHILRMLSIQSVVNRIKMRKTSGRNREREGIKIKLEDYEEPYFGVYLKATLFSPLSSKNITYLSEEQLRVLFEHLFNMQLGIAILNGVKFLIDNTEDVKVNREETLCSKLCERLGPITEGRTLLETISSLNSQVGLIQKIVKEFPWHNDFSRYQDKVNFTTAPDFIIDLFAVIRDEIMRDKVLLILIDEYDELDGYQQVFINSLIRTRRLAFRIASKIGGIKTLEYVDQKELDEIHDYEPIIPLHFDTSRRASPYRNLLKSIFSKRLTLYGNYRIKDPEILLPSATLDDERLTEEELEQELRSIRKTLTRRKEIKNPETYWNNFAGHYREAAVYRVLRRKGRDKIYAGFREYASLSSGVVRLFILLCRDAFLLAHSKRVNIEDGESIPLKLQSDAAEKVSRNQLYMEITKSIPSGYGPRLVRLIQDLGRILQAKLYWSTTPQANRFEVVDSQKFVQKEFTIPREIIENGLRMPHFLSETAFKPKQPEYSISFTFSLNNIFAPVLKIPPEKRWRTHLRADELRDLCSDARREETLERIIGQITKRRRVVRGRRRPKTTGRLQRYMPVSPISLSNCPVTGYGCDKTLVEYIIEKEQLKAFLAIPFEKKSWVYDPRVWIKRAMTDHFKIRCVDVGNFPNVAPILCKICSCVRQMPMGLFETTELNPNVLFELGMATALNKLNFLLVFPEKIPGHHKGRFPPKPLSGIEYISYELGENAIIKAIEERIMPAVEKAANLSRDHWCSILRMECPHRDVTVEPTILIGLPYERNRAFFKGLKGSLTRILAGYKDTFNLQFYEPADSLGELCQLCRAIKGSSFCIFDTTYNDITMLFALGVAFGKDRKFVQLHNIGLSLVRPISDLRDWAIEYMNIQEIEESLPEELAKRIGESDVNTNELKEG